MQETKVKVLEFDPLDYETSLVIARDMLYHNEPASNMVSRSDGYLAVNGAFFDCYSGGDLTIRATMIHNEN